MSDKEKSYLRPIRSFVRREGRFTPGQKQALQDNWQVYGLDDHQKVIDIDAVFKRQAATTLEIGFGMGASLCTMAKQQPEVNFIGIEVHRPGVSAFLSSVREEGLINVRVFCADAVEVLTNAIVDESLDCVQIFFPDPWHKKRHHKRRLIQPAFVELIKQKLKPQGILHAATDWQNYAEHILEVFEGVDGLENAAGTNNYSPKPETRPTTKYEKRGQRLGHGVCDILFKKCYG